MDLADARLSRSKLDHVFAICSKPRGRRKRKSEPFWIRYDWRTPVLGFGLLMLTLAFFYGDLYIWWREPAQIPKHLSDTMGAIPGMIQYWGGQQARRDSQAGTIITSS
ncbi:MAG: hypothetical protein WKF84_20140 [Pyrinomonadaceae bacterium]